tara:strand:- start:1574 stop:2473 length:900 start_codon:yes stop_codon:yes gene_type:complete
MAFLDNSGDIIIDAVLTDTGRYRLAKGDGSFSIAKFALGDDEVDYALYDATAASGQRDLEIMQTPILEAFTNNGSSMKSKLVTIPRNNILYMPVLKANNKKQDSLNDELNMYVVAVDEATENKTTQSAATPYLFGENITAGRGLRIDQGIDNNAISPKFSIESDLLETQYIIEIDNRLGKIVSQNGPAARVAYIDDDNIASYYLTLGTDPSYVRENTNTSEGAEVIAGPRGTTLNIAIQASIELNSSSYLFTRLGGDPTTITGDTALGTVMYIDSTVRIQGATTGASVDLPIRFIKSAS